MKKLQLLFILLIVMVLLALSDFIVTKPNFNLPTKAEAHEKTSEFNEKKGLIKTTLEAHPELTDYHLEKTVRSTNLFEHFNISQLELESYKYELSSEDLPPMVVYELQSPTNQGKFAFLNLKLAINEQVNKESNLNITNQFGDSSLFYNDQSNPSTGFLLVQAHDTILGFQYAKASSKTFDYIKKLLQIINHS